MSLLKDLELIIDEDAVLRGQGADPAVLRVRNSRLVNVASKALEEGMQLVQPKVLFETYEVLSVSHSMIQLSNGKKLSGALLAQHLFLANEVAAIVCTIGSELEKYASQVMEGDLVYGLALYGVGSACVEALANAACSKLEMEAEKRGMHSTIPLNPGMIGWPLEQAQNQIFSLLDTNGIGVSLSENKLMLPLKSLSMVMGFGVNLTQQGSICDYCASRDICKHRRKTENSPISS